jgi:CDP-diacylglycerol--glycerol-3-phosphate 3-phosphatidyltransferase
MLKKMNLPNRLTMLRIFLVPLFVLFMAIPNYLSVPKYIALLIYILASITDFLDGHIARTQGLVTQFGKITDPLADKLLVSAGFVMLTGFDIIPAWITFIILFRDFTVSSLRMFALNNSSDVAAVWSGKIKTTFQLIGIILGIFSLAYGFSYVGMFDFITYFKNMTFFERVVNIIMSFSIVIATITTLWSLVDYFNKFKKDIDVEK